MLIATRQLSKCSVEGTDGTVGTVQDVLFDDRTWKIRYLEIDTGKWLPGRRVILSPEVFQTADYNAKRLIAPLTKERVENAPSVREYLPVSRRKEIELAQYYAWGIYWTNHPTMKEEAEAEGDPHLQSTQSVLDYRVEATDGATGHVTDFIMDDTVFDGGLWEIRYLVIDVRNWLPGRHVLVPSMWVESIDWESRTIHVGLTRDLIKNSPDYDPRTPVNRQYEEVFYDYYGRPKYWIEEGHPV